MLPVSFWKAVVEILLAVVAVLISFCTIFTYIRLVKLKIFSPFVSFYRLDDLLWVWSSASNHLLAWVFLVFQPILAQVFLNFLVQFFSNLFSLNFY